MKQFGIVFGAAVVATLAGCKNPDYVSSRGQSRGEVKRVPVEEKVETKVIVAETKCTCLPGTKHDSPCKCGAADCKCIVTPPPPPPVAAPVKPVQDEYTTYIVQNGDYLAKISKRYNVTIASILRLNPSIKKNVVRVGQKLKLPGKVEVGVQRVPSAATVAAKKKVSKPYAPYKGATGEYVVKSGDSLGLIAKRSGIGVRQLKELNSLKSDRISIGQKLKIPSGKAAAEKPAPVEKKSAPAPVAAPAKSAPAPAPAPAAAPAAPEQSETKSEVKSEEAANPAPALSESASADAAKSATETYVVQEGDDMTAVSIRYGVSAAAIRELNNLGDNDQLKPGQIIKLPSEVQQ